MVEILNFEPGRVSMPTRTALTQPNSATMVEVCDFDPIFLPRWIIHNSSYGVKIHKIVHRSCKLRRSMVFVERVKAYKVTAKFFKSANDIIYSIGFPVSEVKKGSLSLANIALSRKLKVKSQKELYELSNFISFQTLRIL
jgi:hypothetical protein